MILYKEKIYVIAILWDGKGTLMSNVIPFRRLQPRSVHTSHIVHKVVNGELLECVNVDALSPAQQADFFIRQEIGAPQQGRDAPSD